MSEIPDGIMNYLVYSTVVPRCVFFAAKPEVICIFISCELHEPVGQKGNYFQCAVTLPSN
jgi:hypothetical protein